MIFYKNVRVNERFFYKKKSICIIIFSLFCYIFQYAMTNMAKCHLLMGHWVDAMKAAEIVMARDRKNIQAIAVKAESLYNSCFFEHALVLFHRGRVCMY